MDLQETRKAEEERKFHRCRSEEEVEEDKVRYRDDSYRDQL